MQQATASAKLALKLGITNNPTLRNQPSPPPGRGAQKAQKAGWAGRVLRPLSRQPSRGEFAAADPRGHLQPITEGGPPDDQPPGVQGLARRGGVGGMVKAP